MPDRADESINKSRPCSVLESQRKTHGVSCVRRIDQEKRIAVGRFIHDRFGDDVGAGGRANYRRRIANRAVPTSCAIRRATTSVPPSRANPTMDIKSRSARWVAPDQDFGPGSSSRGALAQSSSQVLEFTFVSVILSGLSEVRGGDIWLIMPAACRRHNEISNCCRP